MKASTQLPVLCQGCCGDAEGWFWSFSPSSDHRTCRWRSWGKDVWQMSGGSQRWASSCGSRPASSAVAACECESGPLQWWRPPETAIEEKIHYRYNFPKWPNYTKIYNWYWYSSIISSFYSPKTIFVTITNISIFIVEISHGKHFPHLLLNWQTFASRCRPTFFILDKNHLLPNQWRPVHSTCNSKTLRNREKQYLCPNRKYTDQYYLFSCNLPSIFDFLKHIF